MNIIILIIGMQIIYVVPISNTCTMYLVNYIVQKEIVQIYMHAYHVPELSNMILAELPFVALLHIIRED